MALLSFPHVVTWFDYFAAKIAGQRPFYHECISDTFFSTLKQREIQILTITSFQPKL
jgi:hypothetical protein